MPKKIITRKTVKNSKAISFTAPRLMPRNAPVSVKNSLPSDLLGGVFDTTSLQSNPLSMPYTLALANSYNTITMDRVLLCYCYLTHGIVRTLVAQPIEDALRGGIKIESDELSSDDIDRLEA